MSIYLRNLKKYFPNITSFSPIVLVISLLVVSVLFYKLAFGHYPAKYTESAHGIYANRSTVSGYSIGNCAHCHEMHASIGGDSDTAYDFALFAPNNPTSQDQNFCFKCHDSTSSIQAVINYSYSKTFGGGTSTTPDDIKEAFAFGPPAGATGSSHNLNDVRMFAINVIQAGYTDKDNACIVCHDPHYAQKNHDPYTAQKTAIIRPNQHTTYPRNLWGDEEGWQETLKAWTALYQAPKRADSGYEPVTGSLGDGSDLPNFVMFCMGPCHRRDNVWSTDRPENLTPINWLWSSNGTYPGTPDQHGKRHDHADTSYGEVKPPYTEAHNHVLSCTDCHEPHGSTNPFHLRRYVNGTGPITIKPGQVSGWNFWDFCSACHKVKYDDERALAHYKIFNEGTKTTVNCYQCHEHGDNF